MAVTRLLIVDDEPHVSSTLGRALSLVGYCAEEATSGEEALFLLEQAAYDLMVLDLYMPGLQGVEVMRRARYLQPELLIIILTGRATVESAIAAVKSEAADYLLKPVGIHELIDAITQALQKRSARLQKEQLVGALDIIQQAEASLLSLPPLNGNLSVWPLSLDRSNRVVMIESEPPRTVNLTRGETAVLAGLMTYPGRVLSCEQLVQAAWGYHAERGEAESIIRPYIFRLRRKLERDPQKPCLIRTVRGNGYLLSSSSSGEVSD